MTFVLFLIPVAVMEAIRRVQEKRQRGAKPMARDVPAMGRFPQSIPRRQRLPTCWH